MTATIRRALSTRTRRALALGLVVVITAAVLIASWPRHEPAPVAETDETITAPGGPGVPGTVSLDAGLYLPATVPAPAVILAHGFGQSRASVADQAQQLARDGFVVLAYSARGFGASTGQIGLDSLDYEIPDARAVVDWLSKRPEVVQDGPGDPRVGVTGGSYGGALSLMLAGTDPRVDAVVAVATWNNLTQALFPSNGSVDASPLAPTPAAIADRGDGVFKRSWAATLMSSLLVGSSHSDSGSTSGSGSADAAVGCGRMMPALCQAYSTVAQTGRLDQTMSGLLARSSPSEVVSKIKAPTLLVQGEQDTLFGLDQADANARAIAGAGTTVAVSWYAGGHDGGSPDQATSARMTDWLHHYLFRSGATPSTAFRYTVSGPVSDTGRARNRTLEVPSYPGLVAAAGGATTTRTSVPLTGDPQSATNPPGGVPAAISSLPGIGSLLSSAAGALSAAIPGQTAVFASAPVKATTVITGSARIALTIQSQRVAGAGANGTDDPGGVLFVSLVSSGSSASSSGASGASDPSDGTDSSDPSNSSSGSSSGGSGNSTSGLGSAVAGLLSGGTLAGNAVAPIRVANLPTNGSSVTVTVDLPAVAFQVQTGDSIEVRVGTTDQAYAGSTAPAVYRISLAGDGLMSVPEVGGARVSAGEEPIGVLIGLIVLVIVAIVGLVLAGRVRTRPRRTTPHIVTESPYTATAPTGEANVDGPLPLSISGLGKAYPGGVTAVQDVSFDVHRGQVLGLLGPNGAGKTTTLRMVMGLISPTAGRILVFGSEVHAGSAILSRIGSFVEGAGFLPHLSGRTNLELYWRATGRPTRDAHLEEALQIADLGAAINRRVKTYSHGMRQRLAIAQAMLGLPDLLILDEPTNGLDPPQIHAMREVLRRYAQTGRTVVVSSHQLAEVEQTCSHVVIVNKGRTIAAGTVADLVSASGEMVFGVTEPAQAAQAVATLGSLDGVGAVAVTAGGVQVDLADVAPARALRVLLDAGIEVTSAAPRNRLEDVFLDLVGAGDTGSGPSSGSGSGSGSVPVGRTAGDGGVTR